MQGKLDRVLYFGWVYRIEERMQRLRERRAYFHIEDVRAWLIGRICLAVWQMDHRRSERRQAFVLEW